MAGANEVEDGIEDNHMDNHMENHMGNHMDNHVDGKKRESGFDFQPDHPHDVEMTDSPMMSTPAHSSILPSSLVDSGPYTRPVTRSMTKSHLADLVDAIPYITTSLRERLQNSSKKHISNPNVSKLEDSRDVSSIMDDQIGDSDEVNDDVARVMRNQDQPLESFSLEKTSPSHPLTGQLRILTRRSARLNNGSIVMPEAANSIVEPQGKERKPKSAKRLKTNHATVNGRVRRSPRFFKPLTKFSKYSDLPNELKMMIWEAAIEPRLVYIMNRYSLSHAEAQFDVQNEQPTWFNACRLSRWVARLHYLKLFAMYIPAAGSFNSRTIQAVSAGDILIFEPCHGGCRGCYCARHQYDLRDRSMVRCLAIQAESPNLPPTTEPCWQTITRSWHNVETLYLTRTAVKGVDKRNKAMIRVKKNDHETALLKRFDEWKKGPGLDTRLTSLEFVVIVEKEVATSNLQDRYRAIEDRLTSQSEDIILG
ncbi:hypothetical protein F4813DRAFT_380030 [Daldinia decipiens]|uniref:uncharacterized protein n=1 Tax=Daldinia decipiens TaxID=326647 RepID=UPI0020C2C48D|nr:uncharacterized protein F4813DRAFT_380030 [Daldinia decipiens]KAI1658916.1 hypothetical protein F4813DRAFT_380030 [Daldinia decipiens]